MMAVLTVVLVALTVAPVSPARILMMTLCSAASHKLPFLTLGRGLVARGHDVTLVSAFPAAAHSPVEEVVPEALKEAIVEFQEEDELGKKLRGEFPFSMTYVFHYAYRVCDAFLSANETILLLSTRVDLLVIDAAIPECMLGLVHRFQTPFVFLNTIAYHTLQLSVNGNPTMYSVTPFFAFPYSDRMSFWQRLHNGAGHTVLSCLHYVVVRTVLDPVIRTHLGDDVPANGDLARNASLILYNGHFTLTYPRPFLPNVVEIGCIQCKKAGLLPKELEEFVSGGKKKGFVLVSFGTFVKPKMFPEHFRQLMARALGALDYQVLWTFEGRNTTDLPDNVRVQPWLPQQDLLGHPKIVAFVSHGGLHSIMEAVYHGVPLVCLPVFCDHEANCRKARDDGYATVLDLRTMTAANLLTAVYNVVLDQRFKESALHWSCLLRDQLQPPLDRALYWVEYVLRHRGAPHLRGAARDLNLLQYLMLDSLAALLLLVYLLFLASRTFCNILINVLLRRRLSRKFGKLGIFQV